MQAKQRVVFGVHVMLCDVLHHVQAKQQSLLGLHHTPWLWRQVMAWPSFTVMP